MFSRFVKASNCTTGRARDIDLGLLFSCTSTPHVQGHLPSL